MSRIALTGFFCLLSHFTLAHHAFFTHYNPRASMQIQGTLVEFTLLSPHSRAVVEVTVEDGTKKKWEIEATATAHMRRMGVDKNTFVVGEPITVNAWPNRDPDNPLVYGLGFIKENGERYGQMPNITIDDYSKKSSGVRSIVGRWLAPVPDSSSQVHLPLNAAGIAARDRYDPRNSPANDCEPTSIPSSLYAPFLNDIQIGEDEIVFIHEIYGTERRIPLNSKPAQVEETGVFGHAYARIEGDYLIVESSNFPASDWGLAIATHALADHKDMPSSTQKRLVERYWVSDDGLTLNLEYRLSDPFYLSEEYVAIIQWSRVDDDETIYNYTCEEESASRFSGRSL